jgi:hypothetical protein
MKKWSRSIYLKTWFAFLVLVVMLATGLFLTFNQLTRLASENKNVEQTWQLYNTTSDIRFSLDASLRSLVNAVASGDREEGKKILKHMSMLRERVQHLQALEEASQSTPLFNTRRQAKLEQMTQVVSQIDTLFYETLRLVVFAEQVKQSSVPEQLEQANEAWQQESGSKEPIIKDSLQAFSEGDLKSFRQELQKYFPDIQKFSKDLLALESSLRDEKPKELIQKLSQLTSQLGIQLEEFSSFVSEDLTSAMKQVKTAYGEAVVRLWIMGILIVVAALIVSFVFARHLTRTIEKLKEAPNN